MTRINTIPVQELHTVHLIAEYRELPRIFDVALKAEQRGITPNQYDIPKSFVLGAGHVKFFTNKLNWIENRFYELISECKNRNISIAYTSLEGKSMPRNKEWYNDWTPTENSKSLIRQRINERMLANPKKYGK